MNNGKKPHPFFSSTGKSRAVVYAAFGLILLVSFLFVTGPELARASSSQTSPPTMPAPTFSTNPQPANTAESQSAATPPADKVSAAVAVGETSLPTQMVTDANETSASEAAPEKSEDELKNISTDEVLNMLRNGNTGEPLNVRQLAAINNLIKRMEYISEVEHKMSEMTRGLGTASPLPVASVAPPMGRSPQDMAVSVNTDARTYSISRVSGAAGQFIAVLSNGSAQMQVKQGDVTPIGRISFVSLDGVTVQTDNGSVQLVFSAPAALSGVSATFGRH